MVTLENVNKYFNRRKPNQIHVIDNTNMQLPDNGIVCLLGPSGCGKTTLLNVIGGLDRADYGKIHIDEDRLNNISSNRLDEIRNARIGYIFQNFNLIDDMTVFENVALALRMIGITDKETVQKRVNYCLDNVGIFRFRNKRAGALSGGQRQRVAIARALVKNPGVILADEPTGNLDSANTLEIMKIIRRISRNKLVILVTHEKKVAEFYADHIAEMSDGKIVKAYDNKYAGNLDMRLENRIYLRDISRCSSIDEEGAELSLYYDEDIAGPITLVVRGGNLYINTGGRLNVVSESENIELIDDSYTGLNEECDESDFDYKAFLPEDHKRKYTRLYSFGRTISNGWRSVTGFRKVRKMLLAGFVLSAMFAFLAVSNVAEIVNVRPEDYRTTSGQYITVSNRGGNDDIMQLVSELDRVEYVLPGDTKVIMHIRLGDHFQTSGVESLTGGSLALTKVLKTGDVICGELPTAENEIAIDRYIADSIFDNEEGHEAGISRYGQMLGRSAYFRNLEDYIITAVVDTESPSIYVAESQSIYILTNAESVSSAGGEGTDRMKVRCIDFADDLKIVDGRRPSGLREVILNSELNKDRHKIGDHIGINMAGKKLRIVGFYESRSTEDLYYVTSRTMYKDYVAGSTEFCAYAENVAAVEAMLNKAGATNIANDTRDREAFLTRMHDKILSSLVVACIILFISLIEMFLMQRSSFMSRIREVGVLRAIGVKKKDIVAMFAGEIAVITTITAIPGIALIYYILYELTSKTDLVAGMYLVDPVIAAVTFVAVLAFNLIAGLIPVRRTMRKTPAQILARTDI